MGLIHRFTDLLSANLNELIERYENPELLLKHALREMEQSISVALQDAAKVVAHEKVLTRQLADAESEAAAWQRRAADAVQRQDDVAARTALQRKQECHATATSLAGHLRDVSQAGQVLRQQVEATRRRVQDARRKLDLLSARSRAAQARRRLLREFSAAPAGEEAFQTFERMCRKVEQREAEAEALSELIGGLASRPCEEFSALGTDNHSIEEELRRLKTQTGAGTN